MAVVVAGFRFRSLCWTADGRVTLTSGVRPTVATVVVGVVVFCRGGVAREFALGTSVGSRAFEGDCCGTCGNVGLTAFDQGGRSGTVLREVVRDDDDGLCDDRVGVPVGLAGRMWCHLFGRAVFLAGRPFFGRAVVLDGRMLLGR